MSFFVKVDARDGVDAGVIDDVSVGIDVSVSVDVSGGVVVSVIDDIDVMDFLCTICSFSHHPDFSAKSLSKKNHL